MHRLVAAIALGATTVLAQSAQEAVCFVNHGDFMTNQWASVIFYDVPSDSPDAQNCMGSFHDNLRKDCDANIVDWDCNVTGDGNYWTMFADGAGQFPSGCIESAVSKSQGGLTISCL